ncbi:MAG: hypothetical protein AAGB16_10740 [Pseudomonadota bacterium]
MTSTAIGVAAKTAEEDPVLRLRLTDPAPTNDIKVKLRPRFNDRFTARHEPLMPTLAIADMGAVGKLAYMSTSHPNIVLAIGSTPDLSEAGRQIDRAVTDLGQGDLLFASSKDSAPFIGVGYRSGSDKYGWSLDGTIGAGFLNQPESSRVSDMFLTSQLDGYETEARANLRLRYSF